MCHKYPICTMRGKVCDCSDHTDHSFEDIKWSPRTQQPKFDATKQSAAHPAKAASIGQSAQKHFTTGIFPFCNALETVSSGCCSPSYSAIKAHLPAEVDWGATVGAMAAWHWATHVGSLLEMKADEGTLFMRLISCMKSKPRAALTTLSGNPKSPGTATCMAALHSCDLFWGPHYSWLVVSYCMMTSSASRSSPLF